MEKKHDIKIYNDLLGVFRSFTNPISADTRSKLVAEIRKRGIAKRWYGNFYKMAPFYEVSFLLCDCCYDEKRGYAVDELGNECECEHKFVDIGTDYIPLSEWDSYVRRNLSDEQIILYSDDLECEYPTFDELLTFNIDGVQLEIPYCMGFSLYPDTGRFNNRLSSIKCSGLFMMSDFSDLKDLWEATA